MLYVLSSLLPLGVGVLTAPLSARALGPTDRGTSLLLVAVCTALVVILATGLPWAARASVASDPSTARYWIRRGRSQALKSAPIIIGFALWLLYSQHGTRFEMFAALVYAISSAALVSRGVTVNVAISLGRLRPQVFVNAVTPFISALSIIVLFATGLLNLGSSLICLSVPGILGAIATEYALRDLRTTPVVTPTSLRQRRLRSGGLQVADALLGRSDVLLLSVMLSSSQLGLFSVPALLGQLNYAAQQALVQLSFARWPRKSREDRYVGVLTCAIALGLIIALAGGAVLYVIVGPVWGQEFVPARVYIPFACAFVAVQAIIVPSLSDLSQGASWGGTRLSGRRRRVSQVSGAVAAGSLLYATLMASMAVAVMFLVATAAFLVTMTSVTRLSTLPSWTDVRVLLMGEHGRGQQR